MTQEKIKQELKEILHDVFVAVGWGLKDTSTVADLLEAKSSTKKLIEKIDEYLESRKPKPKFKVGDYVTDTSGNNPYICKIEEFEGHDIVGNWYCFNDNHLDKSIVLPISTSRLSTPEEIAEYKTALNFYKHGRDPFEVKYGDILSDGDSEKVFVNYEGIELELWDKEEFVSGRYTFLKTAEEVDKWLENK